MKNDHVFTLILLIARPAAGKSEIIHYLKNVPLEERILRFHIGKMNEIDDFPMLWTWFEEDALLEKMGHKRMHTDKEGYFLHRYQWDLLIERISMDYKKYLRDNLDLNENITTLVEFSRGSEHGGYQSAFAHLSQEMLDHMVVLYIDVTWEESLRKNRSRFNPDKPDSILEHSLSDVKLKQLYREDDWEEISKGDNQYLYIQGKSVPYSVFNNQDDVTSRGGEDLGRRLEENLNSFWKVRP
jgi:hypothetical protein